MSRKKMPSSIKNDKGSTSLLFDNNNNTIQSTDHNNNEIKIDRNNIAFNQESSESNEQTNLRINNHCNTSNSPILKRDKEMDINDYNDLVDQNSSQCNDDDLSNNNEDLNEDEQLNDLDLEEEDLSSQLNLNNRRTLINNKLTNGAMQSSPLNMCFSSDLSQNNLDKNLKTSLLNNFIKNTNDQSLLNKNFNQESVLSLNSTNNLNNSNEENYGVLLNTNEEDDEDSSNMVITPDIGDYSNYQDEDDVLDEPLPLSLKQGLTTIDDEDELENELINEVKDDREGCRSLICESNGIIIAEMVYRCMVCANISDSINEAQRHYQIKHIFSQNIGLNNNTSLNNYNWKTSSTNSTRVSNSSSLAHMKNKELQQHLLQKQKLQRLQQIKLQQQRIQQIQRLQQQKLKEQKLQKSNQQKLLQFHQRFQQSQLQLQQQQRFEQLRQQQQLNELAQLQIQADSSPQQLSAVSKTVPDLNSLFLNPPIPGTVAKTPQTTHGSSRGGYVTCAVCSITKFYASVQRRYGQFTCMGCAKFFGRFLAKPKKFNCPNLGSCALNTSPRCKACLLLACINTYTIDEKRKVIVNANKPVQRPGPSGPLIGRASDTSTAKRKTTKV